MCSKKMGSATKFIDFFVHDILDYTILKKNESGFEKNITLFNIYTAVKEIMSCLEDKVRLKQIHVETVYEGFDQPILKSDMKRMQQVLLNLYSNAIKFTEKGGHIVIMIQRVTKGYTSQLVISVIDTGCGIQESNQKKLFTLFGSVKDQKKKINTQGIGLGLVISKLIVSKFNGTIDFFS